MKKPLFKTAPTETKEYCATIARDFKCRSDLNKVNRHIFNVCKYNGWLDDFFPLTPHRPLDKESCRAAAANFKTRGEFYKGDVNAYNMSLKKGWMDEFYPTPVYNKEEYRTICAQYKSKHDLKMKNRPVYNIVRTNGWLDEFFKPVQESRSYDELVKVAAQCKSVYEFRKKHILWYKAASKHGWLKDLHFPEDYADRAFRGKGVKEDGSATYRKLTEATCKEIASKYATYSDFRDKDHFVYTKCKSNGWLEGLGLINDIPPQHRTYTADELIEVAKQYDNARDFRLKDKKIYDAAKRRGMLSTFNWMIIPETLEQAPYYRDSIYVYEFPETNVAYVGRTIQPEIRHRDHCKDGDSVAEYAKRIGVTVPTPKYLYSNLTIKAGRKKECEMIKKYIADGWILLNQRSGGQIGGIGQWSKKRCLEYSKQFTTRGELDAANHTVYGRMLTHGWFKDAPWISYAPRVGVKGLAIDVYTADGKTLIQECKTKRIAAEVAGCHQSTIDTALKGFNNGVVKGFMFRLHGDSPSKVLPIDTEYLARRKAKRDIYFALNKEDIRKKGREYYASNKVKIAERDKAYREANKEKIAERNKAWHEAKKAAGYRYRRNPLTGKQEWIFVGLPATPETPKTTSGAA